MMAEAIHTDGAVPAAVDFMAIGDLQRCPELWFEDGTIVLQAENLLFKVYRGSLTTNVGVFKDMFSVGQPDMTEVFEGCPLVRLPDTAKDLEHFLRAIFDPGYYEEIYPVDFGAVVSILRISTKYDCAPFRKRIVTQLKRVYPSSLEDWDNRNEAADIFPRTIARPFMVSQIALEANIPVLLPVTLCACCVNKPQKILEDIQHSNGSHHGFDWEVKKLCIVAQQELHSAWKKTFITVLSKCISQCTTLSHCPQNVGEMLLKLEGRDSIVLFLSVNFFNDTILALARKSVCGSCCGMVHKYLDARWKTLWEELPSFFDLPDWGSLMTPSE